MFTGFEVGKSSGVRGTEKASVTAVLLEGDRGGMRLESMQRQAATEHASSWRYIKEFGRFCKYKGNPLERFKQATYIFLSIVLEGLR